MKFPIFVVMTTFAAISCADDSSPPTVEKSRQSYEEKMKAADERHQQGLTAAKDEYLTPLQMAMDAAFESKDLKEANELDAAIKSMTEKSVAEDSKSPIAVKAKQTYDETAVTVSDTLRKDQEAARNTYQNQLQALLDAALLAKDLEKANRIEAAMKAVKEIETGTGIKGVENEADTINSVTNSIGMRLRHIPPGEFLMGSKKTEAGRDPYETLHRVTLTEEFYLGVCEVSQSQYEQVMGRNPSAFKGPTRPVDSVTLRDANEFCSRLSTIPAEKAAGRVYRLPTEAEWEYACRAGSTTAFCFGDDSEMLADYSWFAQNSASETHPVGEKKPNASGLYDMHGNVNEWCRDEYVEIYPDGAAINPILRTEISWYPIFVLRGGSFINPVSSVRSAIRYNADKSIKSKIFGFRIAASIRMAEVSNDTRSINPTAVASNEPRKSEPLKSNAKNDPNPEMSQVKTIREAQIYDNIRGRVKFMNVDGIGDTIVYVIDTSSSMSGSRLKIAQTQLKASLQRLQPNQKFAVIFYNERRERLRLRRQDDQSMYFANDVNKELAGHEVDRVTSDRGTDHMPALLEALSLKPDVIYFLTDGDEPEVSPAQLAEIRRLAGSLTIHVVRFGDGTLSSRGPTWLERLASLSNGEYGEINVDAFLK